MSGEALRKVREERGWTQAKAAARLGISQAYVALLEKGRRRVPPRLARKAVSAFQLSPALLPPRDVKPSVATVEKLARDLSRLGYPGFSYLRGGWVKNPGEVLLDALTQPDLDARVAEALPWVLLNYPHLDADWLVTQARLLNLTNRLGFLVDLARRVAEKKGQTDSLNYRALARLAELLRTSRLDVEDTLCQQSLTQTEREWLRANQTPDARFWHVLTDWRPEFLQYAD